VVLKENTMDKYYWGYVYYEKMWQLFASDDPKQATPEASGYWAVSQAFDTKEEAEGEDPN
jgi:hypothetical protein